MTAKKYRVELTDEEQQGLKSLVSKGRAAAYKQTHARILLLSDENQDGGAMQDQDIAGVLKVGVATVERVRRRCVEEGSGGRPGPQGATEPPAEETGRVGGGSPDSLGLLPAPCGPGRLDPATDGGSTGGTGDSGKRQHGDSAPDSEKNQLKPWLKECWCIPPKGSADFVCAMEDVLEVYHRQFQEHEVLVCLDETSKQLVQETRQPRLPRPRAAMAYDHEYRRNGVSNLFMLFAPLEGWRRVEVTDRRTRTDWAKVVRKLVDEDYADKGPHRAGDGQPEHPSSGLTVSGIRTGRGAAYRRTSGDPLHPQTWELAEYGRNRTGGGCRGSAWDRRIPSQEVLEQETGAWQEQRNREAVRVDWRFTTQDARIKLKSLYPSI